MKQLKLKMNLDRFGITASTLCAIHCAVLPFMLTILPLWGLGFLANESIELTMISISIIIGVWSLGRSYWLSHRNLLPTLLLIFGFVFIASGHFLGIAVLEPILIPLGGFTIATAHLINLRLFKSFTASHVHE
ncbi:hypothetical protein AAKU52_002788 [Pedobacter sp. CG_S7]|uniref:MerC domain-containing protein n=1 Tax=Pedobacter sp. CG_S7 TaxID=3143930 RepID=UPI003398918D